MDEMQMKSSAAFLSHSPAKKPPIRLEDIPEATPGPNAFAQEAARMEQYRLDTNAFYQQEVQKRKVTPPTAIHPALRPRSNSDPPTPPRLSDCTTMSPFINVGRRAENSPPLKLMPDSASDAEPTQRGYIEELKEQALHERSISKEERIPVFVPTPKLNTEAFEKARPFDGRRSTQKWPRQRRQTCQPRLRRSLSSRSSVLRPICLASHHQRCQLSRPVMRSQEERRCPSRPKLSLGLRHPRVSLELA